MTRTSGRRRGCAIDCAYPFTSSGRSRSRKSSVAAASAEVGHRSVAPATSVPRTLYARPPIQNMGEFENSFTPAVERRGAGSGCRGGAAAGRARGSRPWARSWTPTCGRSPCGRPARRRPRPPSRTPSSTRRAGVEERRERMVGSGARLRRARRLRGARGAATAPSVERHGAGADRSSPHASCSAAT